MGFRLIIFLASSFAALSVVFGAFAAHALKGKVAPYYLEILKQLLVIKCITCSSFVCRSFFDTYTTAFLLQVSAILFCVGIVLFSGSLYALVFTKIKVLGAITPIGGMSFILAWALLAYSAFKI